MRRRSGPAMTLRVVAAVMLGGGMSTTAAAAEDCIVLLRDGGVLEVSVIGFDDRTLRYEDLGPVRELPMAAVLAIVQGREGELSRSARTPILRRNRGLLHLRDGRRIPGELAEAPAASPDAVAWVRTPVGDMDVPLEDIRLLVPSLLEDPGAFDLVDGDRVVLTNGDRLDGFVDAITDRLSVLVGEGVDERRVEVPLDRVAAVRLVASEAEPGTKRAWFSDGLVIDAASIRAGEIEDDPRSLDVELDGRTVLGDRLPIGLSDLTAVVLDTRRIRGLAELELDRIDAVGPRHHLEPPQVLEPMAAAGLGTLELRGPLSATWIVPEGASGFTAIASMPEVARQWGDLELVVLDGRQERLRSTINAMHPEIVIDVPLSAAERRLTIRLEPGRYGPVMDRVRLRLPRVLMH